MTHHEGHHEEHGHHRRGSGHHAGERHCGGGEFKTKEEEIEALESYKKDISMQMANIERRLAELRKG